MVGHFCYFADIQPNSVRDEITLAAKKKKRRNGFPNTISIVR